MISLSPLKQVENFKYLGATISAYTDCIQDIRIRTAIALKAMTELHKTCENNLVSMNTKVRLYRALIQPIALYGCESWTLTQYEEKKLLVFEMAALRKFLGLRRIDKIRNDDIRVKTGCVKTVVQIVYERQHVAWTCAANEQQPYSKKYTTRQS